MAFPPVMIIPLISLLLLWQTSSVPYRAKEDYVVEVRPNFKTRPNTDKGTVNWEAHNPQGRDDRAKTGLLPYLVVNVKILNPKAEELRVLCEDSRGTHVFNKKIGKTLTYEIDMGYIHDIKDHITPNAYTVYALTDKRAALNRIELLVADDGTFLVNGEKRGKF
jgi:hypothetical protein